MRKCTFCSPLHHHNYSIEFYKDDFFSYRVQVEDALRHGLAVVAPSEIHPALVVVAVGPEGIHMRVLVVL